MLTDGTAKPSYDLLSVVTKHPSNVRARKAKVFYLSHFL